MYTIMRYNIHGFGNIKDQNINGIPNTKHGVVIYFDS